jgi:hypothetical protein
LFFINAPLSLRALPQAGRSKPPTLRGEENFRRRRGEANRRLCGAKQTSAAGGAKQTADSAGLNKLPPQAGRSKRFDQLFNLLRAFIGIFTAMMVILSGFALIYDVQGTI